MGMVRGPQAASTPCPASGTGTLLRHSGARGLGHPMASWRRRVQLDFGGQKEERRKGQGAGSTISPYPTAERPSEDASKAWRKA